MKNSSNLIWGGSLVVKCEQGVMAASMGGCDVCVCVYVYVYVCVYMYIYTGCFKKSFTTLKAYRNL